MSGTRNLIIDSNNLLHRVYWVCTKYSRMSVPKMFFTCIKSYILEHMISPGSVYMVWDKKLIKDKPNFRKTAIDVEYKATRDQDKNRAVYEISVPLRRMCKSLGLYNVYPGVLEADDVIAYLTRELPGEHVVVSVDQDMLQLINEHTDVYDPIKKNTITIHNFNQYFPVPLNMFIHYKAIMGDKSDNIPGIPRVGSKTAAKIINEGIDQIPDYYMSIYKRNLDLMDLNIGIQHHPSEAGIYNAQLAAQSDMQSDASLFFEICKDMTCTDITSNFIEPFILPNQPSVIDVFK